MLMEEQASIHVSLNQGRYRFLMLPYGSGPRGVIDRAFFFCFRLRGQKDYAVHAASGPVSFVSIFT